MHACYCLPKAAMDSRRYLLLRVPDSDSCNWINSHRVYSCHPNASDRQMIPHILKTIQKSYNKNQESKVDPVVDPVTLLKTMELTSQV